MKDFLILIVKNCLHNFYMIHESLKTKLNPLHQYLMSLILSCKWVYSFQSFVYHTLSVDGITYLCASDNALDTITPAAFLKNVSESLLRNPLMSQEHFSPSNAAAADFQQVLGKYMMKYNKSQDDSSISTLRSQVTDVKNVMTQNIDKILESEERLNIFTARTDNLQITVSVTQPPEPQTVLWATGSLPWDKLPKAKTYQGYSVR